MAPISSIMGQILLVALSSETASPMQMREVAVFYRSATPSSVPVAQVIPIGGEVRQYQSAAACRLRFPSGQAQIGS